MKMIRVSVLMAAAACVVVAPHPGKSQMTIAAAMTGEAQVKDDLFAGVEKFAQGASEVSDVNLDKNMLAMVHKGGDGRASKLEFIVVHTYSYDKPGMYKMEDVEVFRKRLTDGSWSCSIHTKDKDGTTDVCSKITDGETSELVVMTAEPSCTEGSACTARATGSSGGCASRATAVEVWGTRPSAAEAGDVG